MTCCEILGSIPEVMALVVVVLIAKKAGGRRPVGLLPALYRLWARVRQPCVRRWEADWERRYFSAGRGRSACDIAWLRALRAEYASSVGATAASVMWDLHKAYEHGSHTLLAAEAIELRFPIAVARLAVAMYATDRRLTLDGAFSKPIKPTRGFVAGCTHALAAIKATMLRRMDVFVIKNPDVDVDWFVDDAEIQSVGTSASVTKALTEAVDDLARILQQDLGYPLATEKAVIIDNDGRTAKMIADATGGKAGKPCTVTSKLGVEFTGGKARPRVGGPRRMRYKKQADRRRRLGKLRRLGCKVAQVVSRGVKPAAMYGAPVHGVSDSELGTLSALTAFATSPNTKGTSRTLKLLVADDPAVVANTAVLGQWAAAVWRACGPRQRRRRTDPTPLLMDSALKKAEKQMEKADYSWQAVAGPAGAAVLTARRIGWRYASGFRIQDERGNLLDMATTDPRGICAAVERATRTAAEARAGAREGLEAGQSVWTAPVRRALSSAKLTPMAKASLRRAFTGGYWSSARRKENGLAESCSCPKCGAALDDIYHRIWECEAMHEQRMRYTSESMRTAAAAASRSDPRWTRALTAEPKGRMAAPRRDHDEEWVFAPGVPQERCLSGDVYTDGSATNPRCPEVRRAGWSAIQVDERGDLVKGVYGHVPAEASVEQTAGAGELYALRRAAELAASDANIHTDYQGILDGVRAGEAACSHHKKANASSWRAYWRAVEGGAPCVRKVKAHRSREEAMADEDPMAYTQWKANKTADAYAKMGARANQGRNGREIANAYEAEQDEVTKLAKWVGIALSHWPRAAAGTGRRVREGRAKAAATRQARRRRAAASHGHRLALGRDGWRCLTCGRGAGTDGGTKRLATTACRGHTAARVGQQEGGGAEHILWAAEAEKTQHGELGPDLVWCSRCGAYSSTKIYRLAHRCRGYPEKSARTRLMAINSGRHPITRRQLAPPVRLTGAVIAALGDSAASRRAAFNLLLRGDPLNDARARDEAEDDHGSDARIEVEDGIATELMEPYVEQPGVEAMIMHADADFDMMDDDAIDVFGHGVGLGDDSGSSAAAAATQNDTSETPGAAAEQRPSEDDGGWHAPAADDDAGGGDGGGLSRDGREGEHGRADTDDHQQKRRRIEGGGETVADFANDAGTRAGTARRMKRRATGEFSEWDERERGAACKRARLTVNRDADNAADDMPAAASGQDVGVLGQLAPPARAPSGDRLDSGRPALARLVQPSPPPPVRIVSHAAQADGRELKRRRIRGKQRPPGASSGVMPPAVGPARSSAVDRRESSSSRPSPPA